MGKAGVGCGTRGSRRSGLRRGAFFVGWRVLQKPAQNRTSSGGGRGGGNWKRLVCVCVGGKGRLGAGPQVRGALDPKSGVGGFCIPPPSKLVLHFCVSLFDKTRESKTLTQFKLP